MAHGRIYFWSIILLAGALSFVGCGVGDDDEAPAPSATTTVTKFAVLDGAQAGVTTTANGTGSLTVNTGTGAASGSLFIQSPPATTVTQAHIHDEAVGGGIAVPLTDMGGGVWSVPANTVLTPAQLTSFTAGSLYYNVHTVEFPAGEIRGQIDKTSVTLYAQLEGSQEVPVVTTSASGTGSLTVNADTGAVSGSLTIAVSPATTVTQAHVHSGDRGANGGIVVGLTSSGGGVWSVPAGSTFTEAQRELFIAGNFYFNVHSQANAAGEIRGQLDLVAAP